MLWQMVFEKVAKAALLRQGSVELEVVRKSHKAASRMLRAIRVQRALSQRLGGVVVWDDVLSFIGALEAAHPQLAPPHAPLLEYPWEHVDGKIRWPAEHFEVAKALGDATRGLAPRVARFARLLDAEFDGMFP